MKGEEKQKHRKMTTSGWNVRGLNRFHRSEITEKPAKKRSIPLLKRKEKKIKKREKEALKTN